MAADPQAKKARYLSTPSLGITGEARLRALPAVLSLSTPSLGITKGRRGGVPGGVPKDFQLPLSGSQGGGHGWRLLGGLR